jgi:plasmid stabilization system protein ParE
MIKIAYHERAKTDLARLVDFLLETDTNAALATFAIIEDGISLLKNHPEIGRPIKGNNLRELIISRGRTGYIALYEFDEIVGLVVILRIKHQREIGFE